MTKTNSGLAESIARLSFLLGYIRVANAQRLAQIERQVEEAFENLCANGFEAEARQLRQTSERMGYSMGLGEITPPWILEFQRSLVKKIADYTGTNQNI